MPWSESDLIPVNGFDERKLVPIKQETLPGYSETGNETASPKERAAIGLDETPNEKEGFFKSLGRSFVEPIRATGKGVGVEVLSDETLRDALNREWQKSQNVGEPTTAGTWGARLGGLAGTAVQSVPIALATGVPGIVTQFGLSGQYEAFMRAGKKALDMGKPIDEATEIAKKAARIGGIAQAAAGLIMGGAGGQGVKALLKESARGAGGMGAAQLTENIGEQQLGLPTKTFEGVGEATLTGGLLPPGMHALRAGGRKVLSLLPERKPNAINQEQIQDRVQTQPSEADTRGVSETPSPSDSVQPEAAGTEVAPTGTSPSVETSKYWQDAGWKAEHADDMAAIAGDVTELEGIPGNANLPFRAVLKDGTVITDAAGLKKAAQTGVSRSLSSVPISETVGYDGEFGKGLSGYAYEAGSKVKSQADVDALKAAYEKHEKWARDEYPRLYDAAIKAKDAAAKSHDAAEAAGDQATQAKFRAEYDKANTELKRLQDESMRGQLLNEAHEAATGVSVQGKVKPLGKEGYEPPFPEKKASTEPPKPAEPPAATPEKAGAETGYESSNVQDFVSKLKDQGSADGKPLGASVKEQWDRAVQSSNGGQLPVEQLVKGVKSALVTVDKKSNSVTIHTEGYNPEATVLVHETVTIAFTEDGAIRMFATSGKAPNLLKFSIDKAMELLKGKEPIPKGPKQIASTTPEPPKPSEAGGGDERATRIARLNSIKPRIQQLADKGGLTASEAKEFRALNAEANSIRFDLAKPLDESKIPSESERQSTLPKDVVITARNELMANKDVYTAIVDAAVGAAHNSETAVDDVMAGRNPKVTPQQFYDAFSKTREALRKKFGDTITLFRAQGKQRGKPTQNWATTKAYAEQFGKNVVSKEVPIDDVLAVNVGPSGKYHEVIVGKKPTTPSSTPTPPSGGGLGITPFPGAAQLIKTVGQKLTTFRTKLANSWATRGNKSDIARKKDAADNQARIYGNAQGKFVRLEAQRIFGDRAAEALRAVIPAIESGFDRTKLAQFITQSTGKHLEARKAAEFADANWTGIQLLAEKVKALHDAQIADENANGIATTYRENYIKHAFDVDKLPGRGGEFFGSGGGIGTRSGFKAERKFETLYDAIEAGYGDAVKSMDAAKLTESRLTAGQQLINDRQWVNAFRGVNDPTTGKPIIGPPVEYDANQFPHAPPGYVVSTPLPGLFLSVHEGYQNIFDAVTGGSKVGEGELAGLPIGKAVMSTAAGIKHGLLLFDTFHASRIMQKQFFLTGKVGYRKGLSILEYNTADLAEAVRQGEITQEMADYARANKPTANLLLKEGLNVGRIQEALRSDVIRNIPGIGTFNKWVFDKLTRGAMMQAGLIEFDRVSANNPSMTPQQVAAIVAKKINVTFGNIGRQGLLRSRTMQDASRLAALAPQWVESMARSEIGGVAELAKVPIDLAMGRGLQVGTLGKSMAGGLLAYFVGTQLLNLATRGKLTFQNEEEGHKLDAWIPDITGKTPGYFLNPLSVVAELSHDAYRYAFKKDSAIEVATQIAKNKASPFARAAGTLWNGHDYTGAKITGTWNRIKAAGAALAPTPIPLSGFKSGPAGQTQRQLTASLGVKTEPAETKIRQIVNLHSNWMANSSDPKVKLDYERRQKEEFVSDYKDLDNALRTGNDKAAIAALKQLQETKSAEEIKRRMNPRRADGTRKTMFHETPKIERQFINSLNEKESGIYDQAVEERKKNWERFLDVWAKRSD